MILNVTTNDMFKDMLASLDNTEKELRRLRNRTKARYKESKSWDNLEHPLSAFQKVNELLEEVKKTYDKIELLRQDWKSNDT